MYVCVLSDYRPTRNIFEKQANEAHLEKERVDISDAAKFQSCRLNAGEMADI